MPKVTVEINDNLDELVSDALSEVMELLKDHLEANEPDNCPDLNDLDESGQVHEIVDGSVPISTYALKGLWYLYEHEFTEAYEYAGTGDNPLENNGMSAVYFYIDQEVRNQYEDAAQEVFEEYQEELKAKKQAQALKVLEEGKKGDILYINGMFEELLDSPVCMGGDIWEIETEESGTLTLNITKDEIE